MGRESRKGHGWEGRADDDWFAEKGELDWLDDPREVPAVVPGVQSAGRGHGDDAVAQRGPCVGPVGDSTRPSARGYLPLVLLLAERISTSCS